MKCKVTYWILRCIKHTLYFRGHRRPHNNRRHTSSTAAFILHLYSFTCDASSTENTTWLSMGPTAGTSRREGAFLLRPPVGRALVPRCLRADVGRTEDGA